MRYSGRLPRMGNICKLQMVFLIIVLSFAFTFSLSKQANAADTSLDVPELLRRPGVKLLAVEFYATWCKPCMKAVPQWKRLHEKYRSKGLYFAVVSVGEDGVCGNPGWSPDKIICDLEGTLQEAMGAGNLPQAFLWSWQGNMLASHAHVEDVEKAIEEYFKNTPRILVADPLDKNNEALEDGAAVKELVRAELRRKAKFEVVADAAELERLRELRKKSYSEEYDDLGQCELGQEVSANSELKVKVIEWKAGKRTLLLQLFSVEKGCMIASAKSPIAGDGGMDLAIAASVESLVSQMISKPSMETKKEPRKKKRTGPTLSGEEITEVKSELVIKATPPEAEIIVKGPDDFEQSSVSRWRNSRLKHGTYTVRVEADGYEPQEKKIELLPDDLKSEKIDLKLPGKLVVQGEPKGAKVEIKGPMNFEATKGLPVTIEGAWTGRYRIKVTRAGYETINRTVTVKSEETTTVDIKMEVEKEKPKYKKSSSSVDWNDDPIDVEDFHMGFRLQFETEQWETRNKTLKTKMGDSIAVPFIVELFLRGEGLNLSFDIESDFLTGDQDSKTISNIRLRFSGRPEDVNIDLGVDMNFKNRKVLETFSLTHFELRPFLQYNLPALDIVFMGIGAGLPLCFARDNGVKFDINEAIHANPRIFILESDHHYGLDYKFFFQVRAAEIFTVFADFHGLTWLSPRTESRMYLTPGFSFYVGEGIYLKTGLNWLFYQSGDQRYSSGGLNYSVEQSWWNAFFSFTYMYQD